MTAETRITLHSVGGATPLPVRALALSRDLAHPVGQASLALPPGVTPPELGSDVSVRLVQNGTEIALLGGFVAESTATPQGAQIIVQEPAAKLMRPMAARSWGTTTAGQVLRDLCAEAEVPTGLILPGAVLPHLVLRADATMLAHAMRLAKVSGLALVSDSGGTLSTVALTVPLPSAAVDPMRAALEKRDHARAEAAPKLRVIGAGALGSAGPGASTLPLADPELISAGPSDAPATWRAAALRSLADVTQAQLAATQRRSALQKGVTVTTPLAEALSPGDVVPLPDANGLPLRLTRLEGLHVSLTAARGLLAEYRFSDLEAA